MNKPGKNIKALRQKKGLSQGKVAEQLGISTPAFSKIETGITDMNLSRLRQIADFFGVSVNSITGDTQELQSNQIHIDALREKLAEKTNEVVALQQKVIRLYDELRGL